MFGQPGGRNRVGLDHFSAGAFHEQVREGEIHHAQGDEVRLIEVTPQKKVVWTFRDPKVPGIHHFQILDTNGKPVEGPPLR